jgi:hypothetical protein
LPWHTLFWWQKAIFAWLRELSICPENIVLCFIEPRRRVIGTVLYLILEFII